MYNNIPECKIVRMFAALCGSVGAGNASAAGTIKSQGVYRFEVGKHMLAIKSDPVDSVSILPCPGLSRVDENAIGHVLARQTITIHQRTQSMPPRASVVALRSAPLGRLRVSHAPLTAQRYYSALRAN